MPLPFNQALSVVFLKHNTKGRRKSFRLNHGTENIEKDVGCQRFQINRILRIAVVCSPESDVNSEGHGEPERICLSQSSLRTQRKIVFSPAVEKDSRRKTPCALRLWFMHLLNNIELLLEGESRDVVEFVRIQLHR